MCILELKMKHYNYEKGVNINTCILNKFNRCNSHSQIFHKIVILAIPKNEIFFNFFHSDILKSFFIFKSVNLIKMNRKND